MKDAELRDDPPAPQPFGAAAARGVRRGWSTSTRPTAPTSATRSAALREAAGDALLVGEVYLPAADVAPYLEHLDAAFAFELFHAPWEATRCARRSRRRPGDGAAWVLSNHDFPRLPDRFGPENVRAAAMLLLTLPGTGFVYQGDEIGQARRPPGRTRRTTARARPLPPSDAVGAASPAAGFTTASRGCRRWTPAERNVARPARRPGLAARALPRADRAAARSWAPASSCSTPSRGVVAYARGDHVVAVNTTDEPGPRPTVRRCSRPHGRVGEQLGLTARRWRSCTGYAPQWR